jgi:hypothetical protein
MDDIIDIIDEPNDTKKIIFTGTSTKYHMNPNKKEKKKRVETNTWSINEIQLSFKTQTEILKKIHQNLLDDKKHRLVIIKGCDTINEMYFYNLFVSHIKNKISSYKQQDILKSILNTNDFVNFEYVIQLLNDCELKCHYCSCEIFLLYEFVREMKQWSLDRINNDIGHNKNNLVIACLECNLKRRRTNKDSFMFTKNLKITRLL